MNVRCHVRLQGRVQGVGFRWFARQQAQLLGCTGFVRNDLSGEVEVLAEGSRPVLDDFLTRLRQGPSGARVSNVEVEWQESTGEFDRFQIHP